MGPKPTYIGLWLPLDEGRGTGHIACDVLGSADPLESQGEPALLTSAGQEQGVIGA